MKRFKLYKRIKSKRKKRKKVFNKKQRGGLFGFEYLMHKLASRKPPAHNSLYQALEG